MPRKAEIRVQKIHSQNRFLPNSDNGASKCTKALFFSTPEQEKCYGQNQAIVEPAPSMANGSPDDDNDQNVTEEGGTVVPEFNMEESDPSDFMIDFEMDEHF